MPYCMMVERNINRRKGSVGYRIARSGRPVRSVPLARDQLILLWFAVGVIDRENARIASV